MDERWKKRVFPILPALVEILIPLALIDRLLAVDLVTVQEYERLSRDLIDDEKRSRTLLVSILPRKGPESFDRFLTVLKESKGQEHVAQKIMETGENDKQQDEKRWYKDKKKIEELERQLRKERDERTREGKELKKEKEKRKKCEVTNIGLRNKIGHWKDCSINWEFIKSNLPTCCMPFGRVAEINGMMHVGYRDKMYQLKNGAWEERRYRGFDTRSVFECEGKGYVMDNHEGVCKNIYEYEWKSEERDLELLTEIPYLYQLQDRSAIGHDRKIYLVGGRDSDRVHCFDTTEREWEPIKEMKRERWDCSLTVIDDKMFVGGGFETWLGASNSVECYLIEEAKWIDITPSTEYLCKLSSWNGKLVATGGWDKGKRVELYDDLSGDWLPLPSMNRARLGQGTCTTKDNHLVAVGGLGDINDINDYAASSVEYLKL